jgi:hypothetical protein
VTQALVSAADAELGDVVLLAGDATDDDDDDDDGEADGDAEDEDEDAPGAAWLAHAVMPSPHAATAKKPKVIERSRTAALVSLR